MITSEADDETPVGGQPHRTAVEIDGAAGRGMADHHAALHGITVERERLRHRRADQRAGRKGNRQGEPQNSSP